MQFGPDVDVICPQCCEKAYFTFPYRMLNAPYVLEAKAAYPDAEYQEIAPYTRLDRPRIIKHFVNGSFYFSPQESTWLINLFPKLFSFENAGTFNGLVKCLRCGLVKTDVLTHEKYWYKIPVKSRYLLAANANALEHLRGYFAGEFKYDWRTKPLTDYPGEFYRERKKIVKLIAELLEKEK